MRDAAASYNLPGVPFTFRELITPQYDSHATDRRQAWTNWVGDHADYDGERIRHTPTTKEELVGSVVSMAEDEGAIRAVGSGHSHSNAPAPQYHFIDLNPGFNSGDVEYTTPKGLNDVLDHNGWLRDDLSNAERSHLKRVEAGILLRRLNRYVLHENDLALKNMGSFDGQTIAGAVNTSTHGTGIDLPAVSDAVKSVEIAVVPKSASGDPVVRLYRIEPDEERAITDREKFEADTGDHRMELIQNDDIFHSVVVGYGCLGVVYGYTLEVREDYWLREESDLVDWSTLKTRLGRSAAQVRQFNSQGRHTQILLNTAAVQSEPKNTIDYHEVDQDPLCLVRRHYDLGNPGYIAPSTHDGRWPPERKGTGGQDTLRSLLNKPHPLKPNRDRAMQVHRRFFHPEAEKKPFVGDRSESAWYVALRRVPDEGDGGNEYYEPEAPLPTPTTEVAVPLENLVDAVDAVLEKVVEIKQEEPIPNKKADGEGLNVYFPVPIGIRFTAESEHFLSPEFERTSAMIELPIPVNDGVTKAALSPKIPSLTQRELREYVVEPALTRIERLLVEEFDGRPHMGKQNTMHSGELDAKYPYFDASGTVGSDTPDLGWYQLYEHFNAFGTFDNKFTDQLDLAGFTPDEPTPSDPIGMYNPPSPVGPPEGSDGSGSGGSTSSGNSGGDQGTGSEQNAEGPGGDGESGGDGGSGGGGVTIEVETPGFGALTGAAGIGGAAWWLHSRGHDVDVTDDEAATGRHAAERDEGSSSRDAQSADDDDQSAAQNERATDDPEGRE